MRLNPEKKGERSHRVAVLLFAAFCVPAIGCSGKELGNRESRTEKESPPKKEGVRIIRWDCGVVAPDKLLHHSFQIRNDSSEEWSFASIHSSCSCAVAKPSTQSILPGKDEEIVIAYKPSGKNRDVVSRISVVFRETNAPDVLLEIKGQIRHPFTVEPAELNFGYVGRDQSVKQAFEVHNYSDHDWLGGITISSQESWFATDFIEIPTDGNPDNPRQAWRVTVQLATERISSGESKGIIEIGRKNGEPGSKFVQVLAQITETARAVPAQLFFGTAVAGTSVERKVLLLLNLGEKQEIPDAFEIHHSFGERLHIQCTSVGRQSYLLTAVLKIEKSDSNGLIKGDVEIQFKERSLPAIRLPVIAWVREL